MIVRSANKKDCDRIRSLWKESFHDDDAYLDFYFKYHPNFENIRLLCDGGEVLGMIHLLPCTIRGSRKAVYWYAACIERESRNKGYFRFFCEQIKNEMNEKGFSNLCQPAKGLEEMYRKFGFSYAYYGKEREFYKDNSKNTAIVFNDPQPSDFLILPQKEGSVIWALPEIEYAIRENEFSNGYSLKFLADGMKCFALATKIDGGFLLHSANFDFEIAERVKNDLCDYLKADRFTFRIPSTVKESESFIVGLSDDPAVKDGAGISFTLF